MQQGADPEPGAEAVWPSGAQSQLDAEYEELERLGIRDRFILELRGYPRGDIGFMPICPGCHTDNMSYGTGFVGGRQEILHEGYHCHTCGMILDWDDVWAPDD